MLSACHDRCLLGGSRTIHEELIGKLVMADGTVMKLQDLFHFRFFQTKLAVSVSGSIFLKIIIYFLEFWGSILLWLFFYFVSVSICLLFISKLVCKISESCSFKRKTLLRRNMHSCAHPCACGCVSRAKECLNVPLIHVPLTLVYFSLMQIVRIFPLYRWIH